MSLYNALFGENPFAATLLEVLGTSRDMVPRYRDCYLSEDGTEIVIHTRTGGGNREDYESGNDYLATLEGYLGDSDDDFDCTYANFRYAVPEPFKPQLALLKELGAVSNPGERWQQLLTDLKAGDKNNPAVQRALTIGERIFGQVDAHMKAGESGKIIEV